MSSSNLQSSFSSNGSNNSDRKIRYGVVGLGAFAQNAALPAFGNIDNTELVALVSDDPTKRGELAQKYDIQNTYSYEEYDEFLRSGNVDAVYIALPNHLHCEYTVRAAQAGIHVLCEKPMAVTVEECETMLQAAADNNIKLMIAYRLHLEEANLAAIEIARSGHLGELRIFNSLFTQQTVAGNIRVQKATGGGTLEDIGIYCINAARYIFQDEPIAVFATVANNGEERFQEVDEMTSVILRFPGDRLATFTCSFGAARVSTYHIIGTKGSLKVDHAYSVKEDITHILTIEDKIQERTFKNQDQLAAEFVYFSDCILQNKNVEPSGEEGLIDVQIIRALDRSIATGSFVELNLNSRQQRPAIEQIITVPLTHQEPELINATPPSGKS